MLGDRVAMAQVRETELDQEGNVSIVQTVVDQLADAPRFDQSQVPENAQVLGRPGGTDAGDGGDVAAAELLLEEGVDNLRPGRIGEGRVEIGQAPVSRVVGEPGADAIDVAGVDAGDLTELRIDRRASESHVRTSP
jgi:hypothetical protein